MEKLLKAISEPKICDWSCNHVLPSVKPNSGEFACLGASGTRCLKQECKGKFHLIKKILYILQDRAEDTGGEGRRHHKPATCLDQSAHWLDASSLLPRDVTSFQELGRANSPVPPRGDLRERSFRQPAQL